MVVGASVTLQLCSTVTINSRPPAWESNYHAAYVTSAFYIIGIVILIPGSILAPAPWGKPTRWWSVTGGLWTITTFCTVSGSAILGTQVVLLLQLCAMFGCALLFDFIDGKVSCANTGRLGGFLVVLAGAALDAFSPAKAAKDSGSDDTSDRFGLEAIAVILGVAVSGIGYALQARCNGALADDVGSMMRASAICALVSFVVCLPLETYFYFDKKALFYFSVDDWPFWLFGGFQNSFYVASLAVLPQKLGFTTSYLALLLGKLVASSITDELGLGGKVIHFSIFRLASVSLVLCGTALFSGAFTSSAPASDTCNEFVTSLSFCHETGMSVEYIPEVGSRRTSRIADDDARNVKTPLDPA
eukprot:TRINITY_DN7341_c0_g1_i3.p1 TRINITY_DN7341_c0_g1~~TRINITY_DN7341_c0_g1_i3.p1  ORF type:complete len:377 (-),score=47.71 TRINITY_DN7341_c0_g1_i3:197-1273(-)